MVQVSLSKLDLNCRPLLLAKSLYSKIMSSCPAGHSSDSEDLPVIDNSSKCTPIKHFSVPKAQKLNKSPARVMSPNCKDGEKEKHREKHAHPSTRTYKWTFQLSK